jgi:hypothetical protein
MSQRLEVLPPMGIQGGSLLRWFDHQGCRFNFTPNRDSRNMRNLNADRNAVARDHDERQRLLLGAKDKGPATDIRYNPETRRLEIIYEESR